MVKRIELARVVVFVLLASCGALCQNVRRSLPDAPSPDAPSVQAIDRSQKVDWFATEERSSSSLSLDLGGGNLGTRGFGNPYVGNSYREGNALRAEFGENEQAFAGREQTKTIFEKYLRPSSIKQPSHSSALENLSVMSRATHAATQTLITRDDMGKARLNTRYLLRTLTAVAKDTASTPYWRRTRGAPLSDFGSTVGSDAGMNLWHEFGPSIEQALKSHTPRFVSQIGARMGIK
jgi:hypothetical protein